MWEWARDVARWAYSERVYLLGLLAKYRALPRKPGKFDGPALKAKMLDYEPIVYRVVSGGLSIPGAVLKVIAMKFGPRPMTREEEKDAEKAWMDRASAGGG